MRRLVDKQGLADEIEIDSAGTGNWHAGETADRRAAEAASRRGYVLDSIARQVTPIGLRRTSTCCLPWTPAICTSCGVSRHRAPWHKVRMFTDQDVPDPYYGGERGFEQVLDIVESGCAALIDELRQD